MFIKTVKKKRKDIRYIYYELWRYEDGKPCFVKHIGNAKAYAEYLKEVSKIEREVGKKERELAVLRGEKIPNPDMPEDKFNVILADPPWLYDFSVSESREIENQYPTMPIEQIKALKIPVAENAVLYLWATAPKLKEALEVMEAWGFNYKTNAIWDKEILGMGFWFRSQHEILLIGTKGGFSPPPESTRISSIIRSHRESHSKKPDSLYELLERQFPEAKFLELFASNNTRSKWTSWGNHGK